MLTTGKTEVTELVLLSLPPVLAIRLEDLEKAASITSAAPNTQCAPYFSIDLTVERALE